MVDVNFIADNHFNGQMANDYLDNIDAKDLISFNDNIDQSSSTTDHLYLIDTPPETPVNYNNLVNNALPIYSEHLLDYNQNFQNEFKKFSFSSSDSDNSNTSLNAAINTVTPLHVDCPTMFVPANKCSTEISFISCHNSMFNAATNMSNDSSHKCKQPNIQPKIILPNHNKTSCNNNSNNHHKKQTKENLQKQRLEARKLRNREAALNSRLKKKEYLDNLEAQLKQLSKENTDLMLENALLKQKLTDLEQELSKYRMIDDNSNNVNYAANASKKARISFFAVAFMFFFQISPYLISNSPRIEQQATISMKPNYSATPFNEHHLSRTLLWKRDTNDYFPDVNNNFKTPYFPNETNMAGCGQYHNRTELIRLENELRGWLTRFKLEENESRKRQQQQQHSTLKSKKKLLFDLKHVPIPRLNVWMQKQQQRYMDYLMNEEQHLTDHHPFDDQQQSMSNDLEHLMSTIHRRDDTFYYLSYPSKGHLILPPMSNRTDIRPRFSFLIPTSYNFSHQQQPQQQKSNNNHNQIDSNNHRPNETALQIPNHNLYLLQIDCQVINTKVTLINMNHQQRSHFNTKKLKKHNEK